MKKIIAKTRFGSVFNYAICSFLLNDKQKQSMVERLNKVCNKHQVYIQETGEIKYRTDKGRWHVLLYDIDNRYKWFKSGMNDDWYDPYYLLGVHYFYLVDNDDLKL